MTNPLFALHQYTIRRKVLKIFGASFHIYDRDDNVVGFCGQKAFKLREDIRIYSDESMSEEILTIQARQIVDFAAAYDIVDATEGVKVGAARRKGLRSILRDSWQLLDANDNQVGHIQEDSMGLAVVRRFLTNLVPQSFELLEEDADGGAAKLSQRFNPFVYRLDVNIETHCSLDRRGILGTAVLIAAIEGRQN